jgi:TPR repeat protein
MPPERPNQTPSVFILAASLCVAISSAASGQARTSPALQIPAGVHYKAASDEVNASAKDTLTQSLVPGREVPRSFWDSAVTCGPTLWKALKPSADKVLLDARPFTVVVNSVPTEARALITDEQKMSFWKTFLSKYPSLQTANIRKANPDEINYYWATIPFDIEEPFFAIDTGAEKFIVNFRVVNGKSKLFSIDQVVDLQKVTSGTSAIIDLKTLTMMAEGGDLPSMLQLAKRYLSGEGIPMDIEKARNWFDQASTKGSLEAQMMLGMGYVSGIKLPKDHQAAAKYLLLAADQGNALAQYFVGMMYKRGDGLGQSNDQAAKYLQLAVNQNHAGAEYDLGVMYDSGDGVTADKSRACALFEKASEQGHIRAMNNLGHCYQYGEGKETDLAKATELYTRAANAGESKAQGNLAILCGASGDWESSYIWLRIAENAGATQNRPAIDRVKVHLTQAQIESAESKIIEWQKSHAVKTK